MIYEATGTLYKDYGEEVIKTANGDLHKRKFVLEIERKDDQTGETYKPTFPEFELVGNGCKYWCYKVGHEVVVRFEILGNKYESKTGDEKIFNKLIARRVESVSVNAGNPIVLKPQEQPVPQQGSFDALKQAHQADLPF